MAFKLSAFACVRAFMLSVRVCAWRGGYEREAVRQRKERQVFVRPDGRSGWGWTRSPDQTSIHLVSALFEIWPEGTQDVRVRLSRALVADEPVLVHGVVVKTVCSHSETSRRLHLPLLLSPVLLPYPPTVFTVSGMYLYSATTHWFSKPPFPQSFLMNT